MGNKLSCVDHLLPGYRNDYPELMDTLSEYELAVLTTDGGTFYEGAIEGVKELAGEYQVFLVSNCQAWYLDLFLDFSGLRSVVAGVSCYGLSGLSKDQMLANLKSQFSLIHALYVGDTAGDEAAASLAKCDFVHAAYGFGSPKNTGKSVDSFLELLTILRT